MHLGAPRDDICMEIDGSQKVASNGGVQNALAPKSTPSVIRENLAST